MNQRAEFVEHWRKALKAFTWQSLILLRSEMAKSHFYHLIATQQHQNGVSQFGTDVHIKTRAPVDIRKSLNKQRLPKSVVQNYYNAEQLGSVQKTYVAAFEFIKT